MDAIAPHLYDSTLFRDRQAEVSAATRLVEQFLQENREQRALIFIGARGAGKSWLMLHLARSALPAIPGVSTFFLSLLCVRDGGEPGHGELWPEDDALSAGQAREFLGELLTRLAGRLGLEPRAGAELEERCRLLALDIGDLPRERTLALVVDSAYESPPGIFEWLQTYLITPLINSGRVVALLSGREGQRPDLTSDYLRDAEQVSIQPFTPEDTQELLVALGGAYLDQVETVYRYTGGYPLTIRLLVQVQAPTLLEALDKVIDLLIGDQIDPHRRKALRAPIEALAALEGAFREDEAAPLLAEGQGTVELFRQVRDELLEQHLMAWDIEGNGFTVNPSLLAPVRGYLADARPQKWTWLRCQAYEQYHQFAEQFKALDSVSQHFASLARLYRADCSRAEAQGGVQ